MTQIVLQGDKVIQAIPFTSGHLPDCYIRPGGKIQPDHTGRDSFTFPEFTDKNDVIYNRLRHAIENNP
jgi:hypothetical protein